MQQTPHRPVLIVIAGPNGSGKTTITSKILRHEWLEDAVYVNPDQVAQDKYGDWNSIEAVTKAANYCEELREECLRHKQSLIWFLKRMITFETMSRSYSRSKILK